MLKKRRNGLNGDASVDNPIAEETVSTPAPSIGSVSTEEKTVIGRHISVQGVVRGKENLVIEGSIKGSIELEKHQVIVGSKGKVEAEIRADSVTISGRLKGNIHANRKVEITKEANFNGEIKAKRIAVDQLEQLKTMQHELAEMPRMAFDLHSRRKFRFLDMILGKVDAKSVESIERGLAKLPHVLLPFDVISNGQQVLMIIILKRDRPLLDRLLRNVTFEKIESPEDPEKLVPLSIISLNSPVLDAAFTPDGQHMIMVSLDGSLKLWDPFTGRELLDYSGNNNGPRVVFSPDGEYLAPSSFDGILRIYLTPIEELISVADSRITRSFTEDECKRFLHLEECP